MAKLTEKQKKFCDEYLIDLNATQAAIRAEYSEKTAYSIGQRLLKNVEIQRYLGEQLEKIRNEKIADTIEIMEYLTSVLRGESQAEIVVMENIGDYMSAAKKVQKAPDEKEKLKAAELLGKRYGLYTEKIKLDAPVPIVISGGDELDD